MISEPTRRIRPFRPELDTPHACCGKCDRRLNGNGECERCKPLDAFLVAKMDMESKE